MRPGPRATRFSAIAREAVSEVCARAATATECTLTEKLISVPSTGLEPLLGASAKLSFEGTQKAKTSTLRARARVQTACARAARSEAEDVPLRTHQRATELSMSQATLRPESKVGHTSSVSRTVKSSKALI